ncbi:hypothetical protein BJ875DRAFT_137631 [Amylocarpus encephaloides]|uniref:Uncharacterized protein n=1 Tax=Amylocarpus encephaloides TaxID=45428 RepID=A0A9P7YQP4_9HELO|nr:hypothetical protein BJ875DRAFT_137631 [Amylocarpus encephaloides]
MAKTGRRREGVLLCLSLTHLDGESHPRRSRRFIMFDLAFWPETSSSELRESHSDSDHRHKNTFASVRFVFIFCISKGVHADCNHAWIQPWLIRGDDLPTVNIAIPDRDNWAAGIFLSMSVSDSSGLSYRSQHSLDAITKALLSRGFCFR